MPRRYELNLTKKRLSNESLSNIYKILFFKKVSNYRFTGTFTGNLTFYDGTEAYAALAQTKATKAPKTSRLTKHFRVRR